VTAKITNQQAYEAGEDVAQNELETLNQEDHEQCTDLESRARTHLANERTFLAWLRTGITLIGLGLAAAQFLERQVAPGLPLIRSMSITMVVVCQESSFRHQLLMHEMCYATEKMGDGPPKSFHRK
jgi:hypothetical protein